MYNNNNNNKNGILQEIEYRGKKKK